MSDELAPQGDTGAPAPSAPVGTGTPAAAPAAQPQAQSPAYTYKEDRSNWVPSHVVRQRTDELAQIRQQLAFEQQRVAALSGVKPPTAPRDPQHDAIRNQLYEVAPELRELADLKDKLKELTGLDLNEIKQIRESQNASWVAHGNQVLNTLEQQLKSAYGGADLAPKSVARVQRMFISELENDPEMRARYEAGDPSLIGDFIKDIQTGILDPFRRTSTVAAAPNLAAARRLPRGGGSSAIAAGGRPSTVKPSDGDAYHNAAFRRLSEGQ